MWTAERAALEETLERYSPQFVEAFAFFSQRLAQLLLLHVPGPAGTSQ